MSTSVRTQAAADPCLNTAQEISDPPHTEVSARTSRCVSALDQRTCVDRFLNEPAISLQLLLRVDDHETVKVRVGQIHLQER